MSAGRCDLLFLEVIVALGAIIHLVVYLVKFVRWVKEKPTEVLPSVRVGDVLLGVFWSLLCALIWSMSYVSLSYVSRSVDPFDVNVIMLGSASCFLFVAYLIVRGFSALFGSAEQTVAEGHVDWRTLAPWIATLGNLCNFVLFVYALYFISASQAITLGETSPVFVALLTWLWLRRPLPATAIFATAIAVLGALLVGADKDFSLTAGSATTVGSLLARGGGFGFALFGTGIEKIEGVKRSLASRLSFMGVAFAIACGVVLIAAYVEHRVPATIDGFSMGVLIFNGLRVAVVYLFYGLAIRYVGALLASILVTLEVPFTMLWDTQLLHHRPLRNLIIGALAILFAAFTLASDRWRAMRKPPESRGTSATG